MAITAQVQRDEDLGNHKLVTAGFDEFVIKVKVERDIEVPAEHVELMLPAENCCAYADNALVWGPEHVSKAFKC